MIEVPRRIILGPGPSSAHPKVLSAMSNSVIGYLDPDFFKIMDEVSDGLSKVYNSSGPSFAIAGSGSAGMEAGFVNLISENEKLLICNNGYFCKRMTLMADRLGINYDTLDNDWGKQIDLDNLENKLKKNNYSLVAAIHAETSTGVLNPIKEIGELCKKYNSKLMVDCVTSLGGTEIRFDDWNIDFAYSGTQKCLAAPPGLSPVSVSESALEYIKSRKKLPSSWYLDLVGISEYWGKDHIAHQTTPVNLVYALNEALNLTFKEGLKNKFLRHKTMSEGLKKGLKELCLTLPVDESCSLNQLTVINIPNNIDDLEFRNKLLRSYLIEIGRGLGQFAGKVWRIGLMGESCVPQNVFAVLNAFEKLLIEYKFKLNEGASLSAASSVINGQNIRPY
tara:strand:- start:890 stop:2065 length:1176 start_codon:yes stop_codon:yes gene_type:complete